MKEKNKNTCEAVQKYLKATIMRCWVRKLKSVGFIIKIRFHDVPIA